MNVFFEFHLFSESFTASHGKLATTALVLPYGICLPAAAMMAFFKIFSACLTFVDLCCFFSFSSIYLPVSFPSQLWGILWELFVVFCVRWVHRWWIELLVNGTGLMRDSCPSRCSLPCLSGRDWCPGSFYKTQLLLWWPFRWVLHD